MNFIETTAVVITFLAMVIGLLFTIVPPLPGTVIIWAAAAIYGLVMGWNDYLGWPVFIILTILMIVGIVADILAGHFGARLGGASWLAITVGFVLGLILAVIASFIGTPILGCLAGFLGIVLSIVGVEYYRNRDWEAAQNAIKGYCAGNIVGAMAKLTAAVFMMVIFALRVFYFKN